MRGSLPARRRGTAVALGDAGHPLGVVAEGTGEETSPGARPSAEQVELLPVLVSLSTAWKMPRRPVHREATAKSAPRRGERARHAATVGTGGRWSREVEKPRRRWPRPSRTTLADPVEVGGGRRLAERPLAHDEPAHGAVTERGRPRSAPAASAAPSRGTRDRCSSPTAGPRGWPAGMSLDASIISARYGPPSATGRRRRRSCRSAWWSRRCHDDEVMHGSHAIWASRWVCRSTKPGA